MGSRPTHGAYRVSCWAHYPAIPAVVSLLAAAGLVACLKVGLPAWTFGVAPFLTARTAFAAEVAVGGGLLLRLALLRYERRWLKGLWAHHLEHHRLPFHLRRLVRSPRVWREQLVVAAFSVAMYLGVLFLAGAWAIPLYFLAMLVPEVLNVGIYRRFHAELRTLGPLWYPSGTLPAYGTDPAHPEP